MGPICVGLIPKIEGAVSLKAQKPVRLSVVVIASVIAVSGFATYVVASITGQENVCAVSTTPTPLRDMGRC
jgi:hypothetical protein